MTLKSRPHAAIILLSASLTLAQSAGQPDLSPIKRCANNSLLLDHAARRALTSTTAALVLDFPLTPDRPVTLDLHRFEVLAPDARIVTGSNNGDLAAPRPAVHLFRGQIWNEPESLAFLSLSDFGAFGYIQSRGATHIISTGPMGALAPVIWSGIQDAAPPGASRNLCAGIVDAPGSPPVLPAPPAAGPPRSWTCRAFTIAIDCDYEFTQSLFAGNSTASAAYAVTLLGAASEIYQRDTNVALEVGYLRTWTTPSDPYTSANSSDQLTQFRSYWNANMGAVQRNLAHLFSGRSLGGGIAYGNVACNLPFAYAVSSSLDGFFPYPLQHHSAFNWDVMVVAHETGHNLGSRHTHDPNQYNPPIDGCGNAYLNPPLPQDCSDAWNGTIMSYCHLCPSGMTNINLTFGTRVATAIRNYLDNSVPSCGTYPSQSISQHPVPVSAAPGASASFTVGVAGHTPRTYQWRRDGNTLINDGRITGATTAALSINPVITADAGSYDVIVENFCGSTTSSSAALTVSATCYPNCDGSSTPPILNVNDFICFINTYAASDPYANCDASTTPPLLNVNDFTCFLNSFAAGCR